MKMFLQKFTMLQIALATFFLLFTGTILIRYYNPKVKNDYDVVYQENHKQKPQSEKTPNSTEKFQNDLEKDPNFQYGERLREGSALAVTLCVSEIHDRFKNKKITNYQLSQVIETAKEKGLLLPNFTFKGTDAFTENGAYYLRYEVNPFGIEIVSVGKDGTASGDIFILRLPAVGQIQLKSDDEPHFSSAALWVAPSSNTALPKAFVSDDFYLQAGWKKEIIRINDVQK